MEAIVGQIKELYDKSGPFGREQILASLQNLQLEFSTYGDGVMKLASSIPEGPLVTIGLDLNLFRALTESETPLTTSQVAKKTGAAPGLLGRILRAQAAFGFIKQVGPQEYTASPLSEWLARGKTAEMISYLNNVPGWSINSLPDLLYHNKFQYVGSNEKTAFQVAFRTDKTFEWDRPGTIYKNLGQLLAQLRVKNWVDGYPVEDVVAFGPEPDKPIFVDIGGAFSQQAIAFTKKFFRFPGRVIVQDTSENLKHAKPFANIEFMVHDIFKEQPVTGAKFYYLGNVLNDWQDADCLCILKAIVPALCECSRIIIDSPMLPLTNISWRAAYMDLANMSTAGGVERTRTEWEVIIDAAGLKIDEIIEYDPPVYSAIVTSRKG
ncbi:hypothetical protein AJ80_06560 [Polytolypa hystricis UAMH7299]|uniref:Uncharacterized protein n=1 Tax=Polytolypa hystricis (strain UAMH7299) TaxID=1447883 RepID=A0A2B7XVR5_POLH7|nr:hypothetical protein AJ80_06560 [Polytolypa hystricis UAMH7299]